MNTKTLKEDLLLNMRLANVFETKYFGVCHIGECEIVDIIRNQNVEIREV